MKITPPSPVTLNTLAALHKAAGDELRLKVLQALGNNSFSASELSALLHLGQSRLSHHLKVLTQAALVEARREGNTLFYRRRLPDWVLSPMLARAQQALFDGLDETSLDDAMHTALIAIEQQRSALSQAYFASQESDFSQDPFLAYSDDYHALAADMLKRALPNGGESLLEIGPGTGRFLQRVAADFPQLVGFERSATMLTRARQHLDAAQISAQLIQGDWPHNGPAQQFDAVIINMVLHHMAHPADALIAAARRLKPTGVLLITELCAHDQQWAKENCGHVWLGFEEADLLHWLSSAGLAVEESQFMALRNGFQIQVRSFMHTNNTLHLASP